LATTKKGQEFKIAEEYCAGCQRCQLTCSFVNEGVFNPALANIKVLITTDKGISYQVYRTEDCLECGNCVEACVFGCLKME
jgi:NAD-dependent dihydropyrimidine dehydrogenase PreA subunit